MWACPCRQPAASAAPLYRLEQALLARHAPPRLATYLVCPGLLYGGGEDDAQLHPLFRAAWEDVGPLEVWGSGSNTLPTTHVADLAAWALGVAGAAPGQQYWLALDSGGACQRQLVAGLGAALGATAGTRCVLWVTCVLYRARSQMHELSGCL
jgi:adenylate kinase